MDNKATLEFVRALGLAFRAQQDRLEAAESRLAELGEPVVNVAAPQVSVEAPSVAVEGPTTEIDLSPVTDAISGLSGDVIAEAIGSIEIPGIDLTALVEAISGTDTNEALSGLSEQVDGLKEAQAENTAEMTKAIGALADAIQKATTATQMQFNTLVEGQKEQNARIDALTKAITAPKRIIEEGGKPIGVETIIN